MGQKLRPLRAGIICLVLGYVVSKRGPYQISEWCLQLSAARVPEGHREVGLGSYYLKEYHSGVVEMDVEVTDRNREQEGR